MGDDALPERHLDGSKVGSPAVELEGIGDRAVLAAVRLVRTAAGDRSAVSCMRTRAQSAGRVGRIVVRIGVASESVTLRDPAGLWACDSSAGARESEQRWCDGAFARPRDGRLRDPRLSIGCTTREGDPIGFAWVEPAQRSRYVAVEQDGFVEVHEVAGGLPVRIASTRDVDVERARATFDVSEHDRAGRLVRRHRLEAVVAG